MTLYWIASPPPVTGESPSTGSPPAFRVTADTIESTQGGRILVARGNVQIRQEAWILHADEVEVDQEQETFTARGSILFFEQGSQIEGNSLRFNYKTGKGVIHDARGFVLPSTSFTAEELHREDERTYRLVNARYNSCTVCQPPPYAWEVRAGEVTIHPNEYVWGTDGTFHVKGVPAMYFPVFRYSLADRQTGFLFPKFGNNSTEGFIYAQEFFWVINESQDATLGLIYRSKRGLSPTLEYRYMVEDGRGILNAEYLYDRELEENRYVVRFQHEQNFTSALTGKANITTRSDKNFPEDFSIGFRERTTLLNASSAFLNYALPHHAVNLAGEFFETRASNAPQNDESLFRLPEFTVTSFTQPIWGGSRMLFDQESSVVYFDQKNNIGAARLDAYPSLSLPIPLTSYLIFTPRAALRGTFYSRGAPGIEGNAVTRGLAEFGAELSSLVSRTFPVDGEKVRAIRHTIEPKITYLYIPDVMQDDLPQFDATDFISPQNRLFLSLITRLFATMQESDGVRRNREILALTIETSFASDAQRRTFSDLYLDSLQPEDIKQAVKQDRMSIPNRPGFSTATERDFSNLVARMSITPLLPFSLDLSGSFNFETREVETGNATLNASYEDLATVNLSYTRSSVANDEGVIAQLGLRLVEDTKLTYLGRYNIVTNTFPEHQIGFIYQTCCWAVSVIYTRRNTDNPEDPPNDIRVNLELLTNPSSR